MASIHSAAELQKMNPSIYRSLIQKAFNQGTYYFSGGISKDSWDSMERFSGKAIKYINKGLKKDDKMDISDIRDDCIYVVAHNYVKALKRFCSIPVLLGTPNHPERVPANFA